MEREQNQADKSKEALIIIDVQRDFCAGGALAAGEDTGFIDAINRLAAAHKSGGGCIVLTQDWHSADHISFAASHAGRQLYDTVPTAYGAQILWPAHCVAGTAGAEFHPKLETGSAALILRKGMDKDCDSYSAFYDAKKRASGLGGFLRARGVEKLTFCGVATDFCVADSACHAAELGFGVRLALGACLALDKDGSYDRALGRLRQCGAELGLFC